MFWDIRTEGQLLKYLPLNEFWEKPEQNQNKQKNNLPTNQLFFFEPAD